jgi:HSP20 family protein
MGYIKIRFSDNFNQMESESEKTIQDIFRSVNPTFVLSDRNWEPQMDIYETPDEIIILVEIAGIDKENLELEMNSKAMKIYGRREIPRAENSTYRLAEIRYGKFERILFFSSPIDMDKVNASYLDGLLHVRLSKLRASNTYKIPIPEG